MTTGGGPLAGRQVELIGLRADGSDFPIELTVARLGSDTRAVLTGFVRDITERRALEEQLRQSQKLEAIGRLAGGVAHDFNNILMSIMGAADLLLMQLAPNDAARDEANEIKQSVDRGAGLTRQLLAFSRRQAMRSRLFALGDVVRGMDTMLRRLIGPEIDFQIICAPEPLMVLADSGQTEQVVLNLVVNARDAMPEGGRVTVRVEEVEVDEAAAVALVEGKAGRYARLSVSRHRHRHRRADARQAVRAVLHHQGTGQGHRAGAVDRLRHRQAERRLHHRRQRARQGRDLPDLSADRGRTASAAGARSSALRRG